jgi:hypothetical protein
VLAGLLGDEPPHALKNPRTPTAPSLKQFEENAANRFMKVSYWTAIVPFGLKITRTLCSVLEFVKNSTIILCYQQ